MPLTCGVLGSFQRATSSSTVSGGPASIARGGGRRAMPTITYENRTHAAARLSAIRCATSARLCATAIKAHREKNSRTEIPPPVKTIRYDDFSNYEPGGRGFESCRARQLLQGVGNCQPLFILARALDAGRVCRVLVRTYTRFSDDANRARRRVALHRACCFPTRPTRRRTAKGRQ